MKFLLAKKILKSDFFSLLSGSVLAQLVTMISLPIITRIYEPSDIGLISIFIAFITIPNALALFKLEGVILIKPGLSYVGLLWPAFLFTMTMTSVLAVIFFSYSYFYNLFGINKLPIWSLTLIPFFIFSSGISLIIKSSLVFDLQYKKVALITLLRNVINAVLKIFSGFISSSFFSLIFTEFISILSFYPYSRKLKSLCKNRVVKNSYFIHAILVIKKWKRFTVIETFSLLLDQLTQILPLMLIAQYLGAVSAGLFMLAYKITFLPGTHLSTSYSEIFKGSFGSLMRNNENDRAHRLVVKTFYKCVITAFLFFTPIYFLSPVLLPLVFGDKWVDAGKLIQIIIPWASTAFISSTLSPVFSITQNQHIKLVYDISALALTLVSVLIFKVDSLKNLTILFTAANVIANILYLVLIRYSFKKK